MPAVTLISSSRPGIDTARQKIFVLPTILGDAKFWRLLVRFDADLAAEAHVAGRRTKGPAGYQEAGCATLSFYDRDGERLQTTRRACACDCRASGGRPQWRMADVPVRPVVGSGFDDTCRRLSEQQLLTLLGHGRLS